MLNAIMGRGFSPEVELVAKRWRATAFAEQDWEVGPDAPVGEADPVYVRSPSLVMGGVAKPRTHEPPVAKYPRAAFEKICADLAFDLDLPVPPVTLWRPAAGHRLPISAMSVSLFPVPAPHTAWRDLEASPELKTASHEHLVAAAPRLAVFDSWVANRDRRNDGNLIAWGSNAERQSGVAFIDFAQSLLVGWRRIQPADVEIVRAFPDTALERVDAMLQTIEGIEHLSTIGEIVERIPDDFLLPEQRRRVIDGLEARRSTLRQAFTSLLSELPWNQ